MTLSQAYYLLKPILPWHLRLTLRRMRANLKRKAYANEWPVDEKAGSTPPGWPGWPEGKQFAFILTHDVEGRKGLARVERLMKREMEHGFRSSFNFVPEGDYRVSEAFRQSVEQSGFEVGVHGLRHDGKLYNSKSRFAADAARIKRYLREWNAVGFRSPAAQNRLGWMHELGAEYDASTFDTDPFEPEPYGVQTIFPFWVPGPGGTGYVELPYSLPQDFTLFTVLRESDNEIWKRKLDWVASRGGMALLNVHPDYLCFEDGARARDEYPISFYDDFLSYVRDKYEGAYWSALPREVSRFYCASVPLASRNTRKNICMLAYTGYESDNRVRRYAEALVKRGDRVEVIALTGGKNPLGTDELHGVTVHHVQHRDANEQSKWTYAWRLLRFVLTSSIFLTRRHRRVRYDLVHVHNMPDFLVFAAWYPKLTGAKSILDIHDIMPELFASKFGAKPSDSNVALLKMIEKASVAFVDHIIISNHLWYDKLISRSIPKDKCSVFINYVDPATFYRRSRTRNDDKFVLLFPGTFQWHQGLDLAIEAVAHLKDKVQNAELHLYGGGSAKGDLIRLTAQLGLEERVKFCEGVSLDGIVDVIANADLGVVPKRADSFGDEAYSTKIMEFMSQGVPVVVSRTKIDTFYFDESVVHFFASGNVQSMANAILDVVENSELRKSLILNGLEYVNRNNWDRMKGDYLDLVDSLTTESFGRAPSK